MRPILLERHKRAFCVAASLAGPSPMLPLGRLEVTPTPPRWLGQAAAFGATAWMRFRCSSIIRISGKWPLPIFGVSELVSELDNCPGCWSASNVSVEHVLLSCPQTEDLFSLIVDKVSPVQRLNLLGFLFEPQECEETEMLRQAYVGECCRRVLL